MPAVLEMIEPCSKRALLWAAASLVTVFAVLEDFVNGDGVAKAAGDCLP